MLTLQEIQAEMMTLKDWSLETNSITKNFSFPTFKEALDFVNKVGEIAEKHSHHPDIMLMQVNVMLSLTTHSERGLSKEDFEVARDIDQIK
jgi:4a-hydroxytetrahydrobiopterin dehydratase